MRNTKSACSWVDATAARTKEQTSGCVARRSLGDLGHDGSRALYRKEGDHQRGAGFPLDLAIPLGQRAPESLDGQHTRSIEAVQQRVGPALHPALPL